MRKERSKEKKEAKDSIEDNAEGKANDKEERSLEDYRFISGLMAVEVDASSFSSKHLPYSTLHSQSVDRNCLPSFKAA
jgi:hypothetical protein